MIHKALLRSGPKGQRGKTGGQSCEPCTEHHFWEGERSPGLCHNNGSAKNKAGKSGDKEILEDFS